MAQQRPGVGVERRERLVEQQHVGLAGEGASQRHALALAPGDPARALSRQVVDAQPPQHLVGLVRASKGDVVPHRHVREQRVVLEDHADGALLRRKIDSLSPVEPRPLAHQDPAGIGPVQAGDAAQHRGLAAARRADERQRLPLHGERQV